MTNTVLLIGAFDTKGPDYAFVRQQILDRGANVLTVNTGVLGSTELFPVDVEADEVARAGDGDLARLREAADRGEAMKVMSAGAPAVAQRLFAEGRFDGILGMGGTGGSSVVTAAMRALPLGVPKVCVSTAASGDTSPYVGIRDVTMIPSIVDVAGINRISRGVYSRAAGAMCGMVEANTLHSEASTLRSEANLRSETNAQGSASAGSSREDRPVIAASMFGNTTECVEACQAALAAEGYEVLIFHATGTGGRTLESLVDEGLVDAVLDITTTEWADTVCGGIFDAGEDRLSAPGRRGIPHLIVPGCVDMANFGGIDTVPQAYRDAGRNLYEWNPSVTLMRTNAEENRRMGAIFAAKANAATGPVAFLLPLRGVSILDGEGQTFCDREADGAFFAALLDGLKTDIPVHEVDANINDPAFSARAVELMLELISQQENRS